MEFTRKLAGLYLSDDGRFAIERDRSAGVDDYKWLVWPEAEPGSDQPWAHACDTLEEAKQWCREQPCTS